MQAFLDRLTGKTALRALLDQATTTLDCVSEEYDELVAAVVALQAEITEATDGQIEFLPRVVCEETTLIRQHNRKQFHSVVDL